MKEAESAWERSVLEKLIFELAREQRRRRRWGLFFKLLGLVGFVWFLYQSKSLPFLSGSAVSRSHTAVIRIQGAIGAEEVANAQSIITALHKAFKDEGTRGVIVQLNSPGGSPVQAGRIYDEIRRLRSLYPNIPLHAVAEDLCASASYYVASAADRIYVHPSSLVGSIGVRFDGYGFTEAMQKLGIERRLLTAGRHKGFLDPFSPMETADRGHVQQLLEELHRQFIAAVRTGRGQRLREKPELFSGWIWSGAKSVELGLADSLGSVASVAREVIGAEKLVEFTEKPSIVERLAQQMGATVRSWAHSIGQIRVQ